MSLIERVKSILELDWTKSPHIFILLSSFILSRIPLLNLGFGADGDAWAIATSAFDLRYFHTYHTSRCPGYPLPEYFNSLIIDHGWLATNSMTMLLSLISVIFFAKILKDLNVKNKGLLVLTYAFLPILWINSTNTMDYMWALTFIIIAWFFTLKKQYALAGLIMGLAIGSRITSAILIFPFLYLIWMGNRKIKDGLYFIVSAVIISSLLFLPLFLQHGLKFLHTYPAKINLVLHAGYYIIECFGILPALFGLIILLLSLETIFKNIVKKDKDTIFLLSTILLVGILFIIAPYEAEYLIPMIPFGLIFVNKICKREFIVILCILLLLSNSFVSFYTAERNNEGDIVIHAIDDGVFKRNIEERAEQLDHTQRLMNVNINHSIIIIGWEYFTVLSYLARKNVSYSKAPIMIWNFRKDVGYRSSVPLNELQDLQDEEYTIYYSKGVRYTVKRVYGYDLNEYNCVYLDV